MGREISCAGNPPAQTRDAPYYVSVELYPGVETIRIVRVDAYLGSLVDGKELRNGHHGKGGSHRVQLLLYTELGRYAIQRRQRFCTEGNDESASFGNIGNKPTLILKMVIIQAGQDKGFRIYQHDRAVP